MKISTSFNNFARGKIDHDLNGRWELPLYTSGCDVFKNFISNFKGNAIFRTGFEMMAKFEDCRFIEFKFNISQDYLCLFYDKKIKFLTYDEDGVFGFVQSGASDLVVVTPYSLAESKELKFDQNADVMYITHHSHAPRKLTRLSATSFTLATYPRTADPFSGSGNYPTAVRFYKSALYFANTDLSTTTIWRSVIGSYDDMTIGSDDDDGLQFAVSDLTEEIRWLMSGNNSLLGGSSQALIAINGGTPSDPITPSTVSAFVTNTDGTDDTQPVRKDSLLFYINSTRRNINYFNYDLLTEAFVAQDANIVSYDITSGRVSNLQYKKDRNNLIWSLRDGALLSLNFNLQEKIIGWHEHDNDNCSFEDISILNNNDGDVELFGLLKLGTDYFVCRYADEVEFPLPSSFYTGDQDADEEAFWRKTAELFKEVIHLDISTVVKNLYTSTITYAGDSGVGDVGAMTSDASDFLIGDIGNRIAYKTATGREVGIFKITGFSGVGEVTVEILTAPTALTYASWYKTFNTITGLTDYIGESMSVVADGGYEEEFTVDSSGEIELE